jgi:hypothetical protein
MQSYNTLHLKLPDQVFKWIEDNRGTQSRAAFIVHCLRQLQNTERNTNTEINTHEVNYGKRVCKTI